MRTLEQWFEAYGSSHRNAVNKAIHWVCVPVIVFSILGMLWAWQPWLAMALIAISLMFYIRLSLRLTLAMGGLLAICIGVGYVIEPVLFLVCSVLFVLAWVGQFIGHHIEGKKPSFFEDIQFLLIGPLWVIAFLFRKFGIKY
ncbi:Mpo1 family 2-hydroxy fatty acid dioxygenase [Endozoicomonadaceae bacterium StTr2]